MNKERLLKLAEFLDTVPEEKFDFSVWQSAVGWACTIPEFKEAGLSLGGTVPVPYFDEEVCTPAVANFFKITRREAASLFINDPHPDEEEDDGDGGYRERPTTAAEVAARIRQFVAKNEVPNAK